MTVEYNKGCNFGLSAGNISKEALQVIRVLQKAGYRSYIVGGGVRDLLLNKYPKDFDIATAAHPAKIRRLFRQCRLIGKRFRLAHVLVGKHLLEVATFRARPSYKEQKNISLRKWCIVKDNKYGTLEEDLMRRDFSINAMYYDPFSDELICHPNALSDIENKCLRIIGDPMHRYREDPVRMLRGLRLATKLDLNLEKETEAQIIPNRMLLLNIPPARMFEECKKIFYCGASYKLFQKLHRFQLFKLLFPQTAEVMETHSKATNFEHFLKLLFSSADVRIAASESVTPAFIFAGLWWLPIYNRTEGRTGRQSSFIGYREKEINEVVAIQRSRIAIPKYIMRTVYEIYRLQPYFTSYKKREINYLVHAPRFRAAYDFFCLLSETKLSNIDDCKWWRNLQQADQKQRRKMIENRSKKRTG